MQTPAYKANMGSINLSAVHKYTSEKVIEKIRFHPETSVQTGMTSMLNVMNRKFILLIYELINTTLFFIVS